MVGYNPDGGERLSHVQYAAAGAMSGGVSRALFQPLDVLKIRFQLQVEPVKTHNRSKYHGMFQAGKKIITEEGVRALWKGHVPAQALSIFFGVAQYTSFEILTYGAWRLFPEQLTTSHRSFTHTICGSLGGCIAILAVQPFDVIRTRLVAQGEPKIYSSMSATVCGMLQKEGIASFYKGILPSIAVVGPQMGLQFGFYSLFTMAWHKSKGITEGSLPDFVESFVCGSGSGFLSKMVVHPFDVIKKRLQVQGFEEARKNFGAVRVYHGAWHCFISTLKEERLFGLYKGLTPSVIKASCVSGCHFLVYEQACRMFSLFHHAKS